MTRTGVCVPLEEHTGLEPARSAWKAEMLPITSMLHITAGQSGVRRAGLSLQSIQKEKK